MHVRGSCLQGDVLSLCAQHADATGAAAGVARGFRTEALAAYQAALALPAPPMEAQCSIAELFHDAGKSEVRTFLLVDRPLNIAMLTEL